MIRCAWNECNNGKLNDQEQKDKIDSEFLTEVETLEQCEAEDNVSGCSRNDNPPHELLLIDEAQYLSTTEGIIEKWSLLDPSPSIVLFSSGKMSPLQERERDKFGFACKELTVALRSTKALTRLTNQMVQWQARHGRSLAPL